MKRTQVLATLVLVTTALLLCALLGRVLWLDKHATAAMRDQLARQYTGVVPIPAWRGAIAYHDGAPAALSVRMYNLFADPAYILDATGKLNGLKDGEEKEAEKLLVEALSPLVKKPAQELQFELQDNEFYKEEVSPGVFQVRQHEVRPGVYEPVPRRFLWLKKEVDEDFYKRFAELRAQLRDESRDAARLAGKSKDPEVRAEESRRANVLYHALEGVGFVRSMERVYPLGHLGGSILGFANRYEGVDGLEHQLEYLLRGIPGQMYVTRDAARHTLLVQDQRYTAPDEGRDVWITANSVIQGIAEQELSKAVQEFKGHSGTAVVMDAFSGKILAIATYPFIDPANFSTAAAATRRDLAVTDPYEPGSIFKPFVLAFAIENHVVKPTDVFSCHGGRYLDPTGRLVTDVHGYGELTVEEILVKSSNIGMTQIGWKMGIPMLYHAVTTFGFGQRTGVELPGDQKGIVLPLNKWTKGTLTSASFGYAVAATPLQLVRAYATFANGGYLVTPRIIEAVEDPSGKMVPWSELADPRPQTQILSSETCTTMRNIMEKVYGPTGTARDKASKLYRLFGKTGTAYVASSSHRGYGASDYNGSFLTGGPMSNPRIVAVVTIHKPDRSIAHFGGTVAAPAATAIVERTLLYLQVPPDKPPEDKPARRGH